MIINSKLQNALFKAAKVGEIDLMRELIKVGADPFDVDKNNHNVFFYAMRENPEEAAVLLEELNSTRRLQCIEIF